jgi:hypothetical protein
MTLKTLITKFGGKWVAFKPETKSIVSFGPNAVKVYKDAQKKGINIPTLFKVPTKYTPYIG